MAITMEDVGMLRAYDGMWSNQPTYIKEHHGHSGERATALGFGIAGLAVAVVGVAAVWGLSNSRSNDLKDMLLLQAQNLQAESNARLMGDTQARSEYTTATNRVADKIDIVNTTATSANAASSAIASAENTLLTQSLLGNINQCPQKVSLYSAPQPCPCPASNCACG